MARLIYRLFFYTLAWQFALACTQLPKSKPIIVNGLTFHNVTSTSIQNVRLSVSKTRGLVACGIILPHSECSTTFPQRQYQGNTITVSWQQDGRNWTSSGVEVKLPENPLPNRPAIAVITLGESGFISARLLQQPAGSTTTIMSLQPE